MRFAGVAASVCFAIAVAGCASPGDLSPQTPSRLVTDKRAEAKRLHADQARRSTFQGYESPAVRKETERDSGRAETMMFMRNVYFRFFDDIGFFADPLTVSIRARDPSQPVVFDDPQSFELAVLRGKVTVPPSALASLINDHTFNFDGAPLRKVSVATRADVLSLKGELSRRGKWVPFEMGGPITRASATTLAFTPNRTLIDGQPADALLAAANVDLEELIALNAPGFRLVKNTVLLDATAIFPPPAMRISIKTVKVTAAGLELDIESDAAPPFIAPPTASESYILIRGGDVKFLNVLITNALMQLEAKDKAARLDFSLYDYRKQLAAGGFRFRADGALFVRLENATALGLGSAMR